MNSVTVGTNIATLNKNAKMSLKEQGTTRLSLSAPDTAVKLSGQPAKDVFLNAKKSKQNPIKKTYVGVLRNMQKAVRKINPEMVDNATELFSKPVKAVSEVIDNSPKFKQLSEKLIQMLDVSSKDSLAQIYNVLDNLKDAVFDGIAPGSPGSEFLPREALMVHNETIKAAGGAKEYLKLVALKLRSDMSTLLKIAQKLR